MDSQRQNAWLTGAAIFIAAIALRVIYLRHLQQIPFFDHPIMDASYHDTWAREIAGGAWSRGEPFFRAPLYPYALALVYKLSSGSYLWPRIIQFILGGLTCVITFGLARSLLGRLAGAVAGLACALYPVLIYFEGELLTETLFVFLSMLGLLLLHVASRTRNPRWWLAAGLALGLAVVTRPIAGLFVPLAALGTWLLGGRSKAAVALLIVGIALPVAPVTLHNYAASGEFIPVVWQGGLNFYLGNNPAADGWSATGPLIRKDWWGGYRDMIAIPRAALGREPTYNQVSKFWSQKAMDFIRTQPTAWLKLMLKKAALFWSSLEFPNNQDFNFARLGSWVLGDPVVRFATVAPLALAGLFMLLAKRRDLYFLYAFVIAYLAGTVAFFVCARYRIPIVPPLCIFAGGYVAYMAASIRVGNWRRTATGFVALAAAALLVNLNLTGERPPDLAQSYTQMGKVYVERGRDDLAVREFQRALQANPMWGEAYEQLGLIAMKNGRDEEAETYFTKATEAVPDLAPAYRSLAMIYLSRGDFDSARRSVHKALATAPYLEDAYNILGLIRQHDGDMEGAVAAFEQELEHNPNNWRAYANLASAYRSLGEPDRAVAAYEKAIDLNPGDPELVTALASLHAEQGRSDLAGQLLDRMGSALPRDINLRYNRAVILQNEGRLDEAMKIYESVLSEAPRHEGALVNLGVIYAEAGRRQEALALWKRALEVNPANRNAARNIRLLEQGDADSN